MVANSITSTLISALPLFLKGALMTLQVAILACMFGFSIGLLLGILNSQRLRVWGVSHIIDLYVLIIRGTPVYVQVLLFYFALPDLLGINLSPFVAGTLTLGCNSVAYVTEIIRGGVNSVSKGQWEAGYVLGYSFWGTIRSIILPQMLKTNIPSLTSELVVLLKETSILATIGLLELTKVGMNVNARTLQPLPTYLTVALFYFVLTMGITAVSKKIEKGLNND